MLEKGKMFSVLRTVRQNRDNAIPHYLFISKLLHFRERVVQQKQKKIRAWYLYSILNILRKFIKYMQYIPIKTHFIGGGIDEN